MSHPSDQPPHKERRPLRLFVTQEDIQSAIKAVTANGTKNLPQTCPIAQCLFRMGYKKVLIGGSYATIDGQIYLYDEEAKSFIDSFNEDSAKGFKWSTLECTLTPYNAE